MAAWQLLKNMAVLEDYPEDQLLLENSCFPGKFNSFSVFLNFFFSLFSNSLSVCFAFPLPLVLFYLRHLFSIASSSHFLFFVSLFMPGKEKEVNVRVLLYFCVSMRCECMKKRVTQIGMTTCTRTQQKELHPQISPHSLLQKHRSCFRRVKGQHSHMQQKECILHKY